jgi:CRISPR-associated endonuclease/helicase Cas3
MRFFANSLARPDSLLEGHLKDVKISIEKYLSKDYFAGYDPSLSKLASLAGLCHDMGKNHLNWQRYIIGEMRKGPNHSDFGAFLFSYLGVYFLEKEDLWEKHKIEWIWLTRDIADHHSKLKNLSDDNWIKVYDWNKYDLSGIEGFVRKLYKELNDIVINWDELDKWVDKVDKYKEDANYSLFLSKKDKKSIEFSIEIQKWRILTTSLIMGDRFNVSDVESTWIDKTCNSKYINNINKFCKTKQGEALSDIRMKAQNDIMVQVKENPDSTFYTLCMPTGFGKTVTALKIATWFIENLNYKKIIYVAPYLSILEQTSNTIEETMGEKPLEHHSLAIIDNDEQRTGESQLWMESWAHSLICTSFNQFFKALFPVRAQDVLRRTFIKDSIIIVDEPQIFDPNVWNIFLHGVEGLSRLLNLKVIFVSATMPPFDYGLSKEPITLTIKSKGQKDRYTLHISKKIEDEISLANLCRKNEKGSQALILNTIEDAYRVYKEISVENAYLLHGLMIPIHKKYIIEKIKNDLKNKKYPISVVSTQVLEAGVDVSFEKIYRALPILPSIVQAAGRVNRHGEREKGIIYTFPFYRSSKRNTRDYIYPKELTTLTDKLLNRKDLWGEKTIEFANYAKDIGIEIYQTHLASCDFMYNYDEYNVGFVKMGIEATSLLGAKYAILHPANPMTPEEDGMGITIEFFKKHIEYAKSVGVDILVENMRISVKKELKYRYCSDVDELCELADLLGIGICWDTGHANILRDVDQREELKQVGKRLKALHINDNTGIDDDSHILPYTGNVPFDEIIPILNEIGYKGTLNFELSGKNLPPIAIDSYVKCIFEIGVHFKNLLSIT